MQTATKIDESNKDSTESASAQRNKEFVAGLSLESFWIPEYIAKSGWIEHAPFAFWVTKELNPSCFVELGTHFGYSYFAFCQAVAILGLNTRCYAIDTWQGDEHAGFYPDHVYQQVHQHNLYHYSSFSRLVRSTFIEALPQFEDGSVDLIHIDGRHFYEDVKEDFETWLPKLSNRAIALFHDTNVREKNFGVAKYFGELKKQYPHFEHYHGHGLGVLAIGSDLPESIKEFFSAVSNDSTAQAVRNIYARLGKSLANDYQMNVTATQLRTSVAKSEVELKALQGQLEKNVRAFKDAHTALEGNRKLVAELRTELSASKKKLSNLTELYNTNIFRLSQLEFITDDYLRSSYRKLRSRFPNLSRRLAHLRHIAHGVLTFDKRALKNWRASSKRRGLIVKSGIFDSAFYLENIPGLGGVAADLVAHYLERGASEGLNPHPLFSSFWYLYRNPDVSAFGENPLIHYITCGDHEGRQPNPLFDGQWYRTQLGDIRIPEGETALAHYLRTWNQHLKDPSPLFSTSWYLTEYPDVKENGVNPLQHFLERGYQEGRFSIADSKKRETVNKLIALWQDFESNSLASFVGNLEKKPKSVTPLQPLHDLSIVQFTLPNPKNPYYSLVGKELKSCGWNFSYDIKFDSILHSLKTSRNQKTIIHFHQLEAIYRKKGMNEEEVSRSASELLENIAELKSYGAKIVWTQHNPLPHDRTFAEVDRKVLRVMSFIADKIVTLSELAKEEMYQYTCPSKVVKIHHPSFEDVYGPQVDRDVARKKLGLSEEEKVFLVAGELKPYKGIELIFDAFRSASERTSEKLRLLVVGEASDSKYIEGLRKNAPENVTFNTKRLTGEELVYYLGASDCSLFAFKDIWMSSSVVLSLSYNVPVIVPTVGSPPAIVEAFQVGEVYQHNSASSLADSIVSFVSDSRGAHQKYMCNEYKSHRNITSVANDFASLYRELAKDNYE